MGWIVGAMKWIMLIQVTLFLGYLVAPEAAKE